MKVWRVSSTQPSEESLLEAAQALKSGRLVAFPTETVYGLGANALDEAAVRRIFAAKGRPADNPLIVHIADLSQLPQVIDPHGVIPPAAKRLMEVFWPGPLTIILPVHPQLAPSVHPGMATVGVRIPNHPVAQKLLALAGCPVAAPSANKSGRPSPTTAMDVLEDMSLDLVEGDGVVDGGSCDVGVESTVIGFEEGKVVIYRPGGISQEQLEAQLDVPVLLDPHITLTSSSPSTTKRELERGPGNIEAGFAPRSPGMKYRHYAPKAQVWVWWGKPAQMKQRMMEFAANHADQELGLITQHPWGDCPGNVHCWAALGLAAGAGTGGAMDSDMVAGRGGVPGSESSLAAYTRILSRELYRLLREFDRHQVAHILIEGVPPTGLGLAVMNRLMKASEGRIERL